MQYQALLKEKGAIKMDDNKIPSFLEDLKNYLCGIKNLSMNYIDDLEFTIVQFLEFINVHTLKEKYDDINEITLNDIRSLKNNDIYGFIFFLSERHYKANTRIKKIEHLKTFFNYLYTICHRLFKQPFKLVKTEKKLEQKLPNYLSLSEAKKVQAVYEHSYKISDIRNNALIRLILNCGLRLSEAANLNIEDLNLSESKFVVIGKGNKERTCYLNKPTKEALEDYLKFRNKLVVKNKKHKDALFLSNQNVRLSKRQIRTIVKESYKKAGLDETKYATHTLRHTCATLLYRNGTDIRTIQEVLGHVQIDTTEIYTHLYNKQVMDAMLEHPMSDFMIADAVGY